jgi:hypothetical protein
MKKKTNISDKTLNLIAKRKIKPIPKWEFIAKNWVLWTSLIICLILLILGFSLTIFGFIDNIIVPYLWSFIAVIFLLVTYFLFEKTKGAYHFPKWQILISITVLGLIIALAFFKIGLALKLDKSLDNLPYYRQMVPMKLTAWSNPQSGYLSGTITKIIDKNSFELIDFSKKFWIISTENAIVRGRVSLIIGQEIKLIGTQNSDTNFKADEIRPWTGMGQNMMKEN